MRNHHIRSVCCVFLVGALAACAGGPGRHGPRGSRLPEGGPEEAAGPRALKNSTGLLLASYDSNQDMQVTRAELTTGIDRAFARADLNGDGDIAPLEFDVFSKAALDGGKSPPFRLDFDRDVDGRIVLKEFRTELTAIAGALDADKDGALNHSELLKALEAQARVRAPAGGGEGRGGPGGPPGGGRDGGGGRPR